MVIRDSEGFVMASSCQRVIATFDPQVAEAVAIQQGLLLSHDSGLGPVVMESDAQVVVGWIKDGSQFYSNVGMIIVDICELLRAMNCVSMLGRLGLSTLGLQRQGADSAHLHSSATKCEMTPAAVAWEPGKPLVIEEVEVAPPQTMEVRLKILFTSLCHTDVYFWEAKGQTPLFPRIFGHEAGGIVESVGEGVTDLKPGDHVLPVFTGECKECRHCKSEESNMCDLLRINTDRGVMLNDGKSRFSINGQPIYHFVGTSTFSEYTVVHVGCVAKINPAAPLDKVCVLSCGISTGLGATLNVAKPKKGSSVAIFGLGAVGLAAAEGARISGASRIIGVDLNPKRFDEAKKFGVTEFVNPKDYDKPVQEVIAEMTNGGVDRSVECTGSINAMISAFECVHDGWGVAVLVGVPNKDDAFKTHPMNLLNERTLRGTFFGNYKPRSDLPSVVEKYMNKELELEKFITHEVPFSEINKAFEYMLRGDGLRCIIRMDA
ncbi:hypothetical protein Q3G72_009083 [Acer saccharum]|nr:hypothetical protein Q3G72_009083 [Acer saccharum]